MLNIKNGMNEQLSKSLVLLPVVDLIKESFFIPSYQRGYRWQDRQVEELLDDLLEFQTKEKEEGEFYCLQPIVVKKYGDKWEVIDGQQRLTTLYLILLYLKNLLIEDFFIEDIYALEYETREKSFDFLKHQVVKGELDNSNIDFYHMSNAFEIIKNWFETNIKERKITKRKFLEVLIDKNIDEKTDFDKANNVRFIWFNADKDVDAKEVFTRINMGKIPLTNAELIKAIFLKNSNHSESESSKSQLKIAYEWDNIEYALQEENFWFFLNKKDNHRATRIEFIFDLIAENKSDEIEVKANKSIDSLYTYHVFDQLIREEVSTKESLWEEAKTYYRTFEEWYSNNDYFHLIGYLIHVGYNIQFIKSKSEDLSKSEFLNFLKDQIRDQFKFSDIEDLDYIDSYDDITDVLLLFNIISTKKSEYNRFPFERFIKEAWSLEHIHAQNSEVIKNDLVRRNFMDEQRLFFTNKDTELAEKITELLTHKRISENEFEALQKEIFKIYSDESNLHTIENLALLSRKDNSTINNNIFPIKRDQIKKLDEQGSFIPICTKNVFLKYYSPHVKDNLSWNMADRAAYLTAMKNTLKEYLPNSDEHAN